MAAETPLRELQRSTTNKHAIVAHGQLCAVLAAATGAAASMLAASGVNAPTAQSAFVYAILALIYADDASDTAPGPLVWLAIAIFDVEGNYLVIVEDTGKSTRTFKETTFKMTEQFFKTSYFLRHGRLSAEVPRRHFDLERFPRS